MNKTIMSFGRFKGRLVEELPQWYVDWLSENVEIKSAQLRAALEERKPVEECEPKAAKEAPHYTDHRAGRDDYWDDD